MMAQKYLHELLEEDQEPFLLNKYISERRSQIKTQISPRKKHKPLQLQHNSNFPTNLCTKICLFSTTPDLGKSPFFEFQSPSAPKNKSPSKFHIPSRTANLLLEAAIKIQNQKHCSKTKTKTKTQNKSNGFGLLGYLFKRLTHRNQKRNEIVEGSHVNLSVKDILKWESRKISNGCIKEEERLDFCNGRRSSVWSESNEDKSLDMETPSSSSSSRHCDDDSELQEIEFITNQKHDIECACSYDINGFCNSPFRFVLQRSPSSGHHTPELPSPAQSPDRHIKEEKDSNEEEEGEDKEQCSPVCVLDPPFEDDDEGQGNYEEDDDDDDEDSSDLSCSYAIMQRAKQQLLYKLHRFEKLAELDPVELEKRMLEDEGETFTEEDEDDDYEDSEASYKENEFIEQVFESLCHSSIHDKGQIPEELKKLVSDLIVEEDREEDREIVIKRVCKKLELWKEVEYNTIDMMIEEDFSRENGEWKKNMVQVKDIASELELAIFGFLVDEFSEELVC